MCEKSGMKSNDQINECTNEVLDRLSAQYARISDKAQGLSSSSGSAHGSPRLHTADRSDAIRAELSTERPAVWDAMQRADAAMRALATDHNVRLDDSAPPGSAAHSVPAAARRLELLHAQRLRDGEEMRDMHTQGARARSELQANLDATPRLLDAVADGTAGLSELETVHALCRENAERIQRIQARLVRVAEAHREITEWSNVQFGRLDIEIEAVERQVENREETFMPKRKK